MCFVCAVKSLISRTIFMHRRLFSSVNWWGWWMTKSVSVCCKSQIDFYVHNARSGMACKQMNKWARLHCQTKALMFQCVFEGRRATGGCVFCVTQYVSCCHSHRSIRLYVWLKTFPFAYGNAVQLSHLHIESLKWYAVIVVPRCKRKYNHVNRSRNIEMFIFKINLIILRGRKFICENLLLCHPYQTNIKGDIHIEFICFRCCVL